jgi:hypothetical protein
MDREQEIKEIQQLIATANGDTLKYLHKRLGDLLYDKCEQKQESPKKKEAQSRAEEKSQRR